LEVKGKNMTNHSVEGLFKSSVNIICSDTMQASDIDSIVERKSYQNIFMVLMSAFYEVASGATPILLEVSRDEGDIELSLEVSGLDDVSPADALLIGVESVTHLCDENNVFNSDYVDELTDKMFDGYEVGDKVKLADLASVILAEGLSKELLIHEDVEHILNKELDFSEAMNHGFS
jgi:hypothetical protein